MKLFGIAFLGVTHPHASGRLRAMMARDDVRVLGAADDHAVVEPFVHHFGIPRRSKEEILADPQVHGVLLHGKSDENPLWAVEALRAGKAVLIEKPGGRHRADLDALVAAVEETQGVCQVGYTFRFSPSVAITQHVLEQGLLGKILQVRVHGACSLDEARTSHLNQPEDMGGAFFVIGCHVIDLLLHHLGMPRVVNARVPKFAGVFDAHSREDAASAIFQYDTCLVSLDFFSWDPLPWVESWEIALYGTEGVLHTCPLPAQSRLFLKEARGSFPAGWTSWNETSFPTPWAARTTAYSPELAEIAHTTFFEREAEAFLAAARGQAPVPISVQHARDILRVIAACYTSSQQHGQEEAVSASASLSS